MERKEKEHRRNLHVDGPVCSTNTRQSPQSLSKAIPVNSASISTDKQPSLTASSSSMSDKTSSSMTRSHSPLFPSYAHGPHSHQQLLAPDLKPQASALGFL